MSLDYQKATNNLSRSPLNGSIAENFANNIDDFRLVTDERERVGLNKLLGLFMEVLGDGVLCTRRASDGLLDCLNLFVVGRGCVEAKNSSVHAT